MLLEIPREILGLVLRWIDILDLVELLKVNHEAHDSIINLDYLWKHKILSSGLVADRIELTELCSEKVSFYQQFKTRYKWAKRLHHYMQYLAHSHICYNVVYLNEEDEFLMDIERPGHEQAGDLAFDKYKLTLHKILAIKHSNNRYTNLTSRFYGEYVMQQIRQQRLISEYTANFRDNSSSYMSGMLLIANWISAMYREDRPCIPVSETLDQLARQAILKFNDNDTIEQRLDKLNVVLFEEYKLTGNPDDYYNVENSCIDKVLYTRRGIPLTMSMIYHEVALRCGITLQPINFPRHFLLSYTNDGQTLYIDSFNKGVRLRRDDCLNLCPISNIPDSDEYFREADHRELLSRTMRNVIYAHTSYTLDDIKDKIDLYKLLYFINPGDEQCVLEAANSSLNMGLSPGFVSSYMQQSAIRDDYNEKLRKQKEKIEKFRVPKLQHPETVNYRIGTVKLHKRYHYYCVIYGWDEVCMLGRNWEIRMGIDSLEHGPKQPFYHVLVDDNSERYAAQENLVDTHGCFISHRNVGKYFESFDGEKYIPNNALQKIYPNG